jgi:hypothetical protein
MKGTEITATNPKTTAIYRIFGKNIFIKFHDLKQAAPLLSRIKAMGGSYEIGKNWIKADLFGQHKTAKIGGVTLDLEKATDDAVEEALVSFWLDMLEKAKFKCEVKKI